MKKSLLLVLCLLPLGFGCISKVSSVPSHVISSNTSDSVFTSPTPGTYPSPTYTSDPLEGYELYSKRVGCLPIDPNLKPKLDYPVDLAVTKDGKKVYVVNSRKEGNVSYYSREKTYKSLVNRQYIYEIKDDKTISILKVDGEYPFSCHLSEEIEMDNNENLYISKPIINYNFEPNLPIHEMVNDKSGYKGHEIYKIDRDKKMSLYNQINLNTPDVRPTAMVDPTLLTNLHLDDQGSTYYMLRSEYMTSKEKLIKVDDKNNITQILFWEFKFSGSISDFSVFKERIYLSYMNFPIKERFIPPIALDDSIDNYDRKKEVDKDGLIIRDIGLALDKIGNIYASDWSNGSIIWKITTDKKLIKFAGNGQAGYKDGKGEEAQFNKPTTMVFDESGNMFVADSGNNAIRKITPDGTVSTFYKEIN